MALPDIGIKPTKDELNRELGQLAKDTLNLLSRWAYFKAYLDQFTTAEMTSNWGWTNGSGAEADTIKSAVADGNQINDIFLGAASLAVAKDFRAFMKKLYGAGGAY